MLLPPARHLQRLGNLIGVLREGMEADLICLETGRPHATPIYDPFSHLVFAARATNVRHVLVRGRVVVKDWKATTMDEERIRAQATEAAARIRG